MAPKRKSDVMEQSELPFADFVNENKPVTKKARASDASAAEASGSKGKTKAKESHAPTKWQDVTLEGEDEDCVPIYDDCNEIRRKIRLLQKQSGWKVTHWLRDIGGINSNSFNRFMKDTGASAGATNGTYKAAYIYFEKVRIAEGKKKTGKRESNEAEFPNGLSLSDRRKVWVFGK